MERMVQPHPRELEGLDWRRGGRSPSRELEKEPGKGGRIYHHNVLPGPDGGGTADWCGRHENVRFQESSRWEGANCVGISQGTTLWAERGLL